MSTSMPDGTGMTEVKRLRVFVVDDEPVIAFTLATILESSGYTARPFTDPLEALRAAETNCPDYLISDVMMPLLNGIDLGVQFKAIYPQVKVLLFSGMSSIFSRNRCIRSGCWPRLLRLATREGRPSGMVRSTGGLGPSPGRRMRGARRRDGSGRSRFPLRNDRQKGKGKARRAKEAATTTAGPSTPLGFAQDDRSV
jgi:CheY-like chemotaxis protein